MNTDKGTLCQFVELNAITINIDFCIIFTATPLAGYTTVNYQNTTHKNENIFIIREFSQPRVKAGVNNEKCFNTTIPVLFTTYSIIF